MYIIFPLQYVLTTVIVFVLHILSITKAVTTFDEKSNQAALKYLYRIMFFEWLFKMLPSVVKFKTKYSTHNYFFFQCKTKAHAIFFYCRGTTFLYCVVLYKIYIIGTFWYWEIELTPVPFPRIVIYAYSQRKVWRAQFFFRNSH